jgi:pre-mRNA-processing factor 17
LVWEYGIPVVVKHISEPDMHSMPAVAMSPNGKYFVGQSQGIAFNTNSAFLTVQPHDLPHSLIHDVDDDMIDNQILLFDAFNRFKLNRKKRFVGHLTAGMILSSSIHPYQYLLSLLLKLLIMTIIGYACGLSFSPDGSLLMSGDAEGRLFVWSFKKGAIYK